MSDRLRQEIADAAGTIVVKVGTRVLTTKTGELDRQRIGELAEEVSQIRDTGRNLVIVSSGAVAAGISRIGLSERPQDLAKLQAMAAIGQTSLIEAYDHTFRQYRLHAAQVLLTADDFEDRARYLNVRNTLLSLLEYGAIPIINENDTVAVDELMVSFGDNDRLAALVTNLLRAPLLVVLSDVDGLYDGRPGMSDSKRLSTVEQIDEAVFNYAQDRLRSDSKGGMASKLIAAQSITAAGENMIIANGREPKVLGRILNGEDIGTLFPAQGKTVSPWKRWIAYSAQSRGKLLLDSGACNAIATRGSSLLAIGITDSNGDFEKGDVVSLCTPDGRELARGLTNYAASEIGRIQGLRSGQIASVLGHCPYEEVIHRDNMAVL